MKIVLTGGSGDLGQLLVPQLKSRGDCAVVVDVREVNPATRRASAPVCDDFDFVQASITDRQALKRAFAGAEQVVHIAAWHGLHEFRKEKDAYEFWDLNVTGTFNVFQAAADAGIKNVVFISSTSIDERFGVYGHSKILGEELTRAYAARHAMNMISLRPRAFIPYWNRTVYDSYVDWAKWFWSGAVHIDDVAQSVLLSVDLLRSGKDLPEALFLTIDGAYDYSDEDLSTWDKDGPGSTFKKYYPEHYDLAVRHGLNPAQKPKKLDISETERILGYKPQFSLRSLLAELKDLEPQLAR